MTRSPSAKDGEVAEMTFPETLSAFDSSNLADLKFDDESMMLVMLGLAGELNDFALSRGIPGSSVEVQLSFLLREFHDQLGCLLDIREVPARAAADLASLEIHFSLKGYRRLAGAAKDLMGNAVDG